MTTVKLEVLPRFELGSPDSESEVLTVTPQNPRNLVKHTIMSYAFKKKIDSHFSVMFLQKF